MLGRSSPPAAGAGVEVLGNDPGIPAPADDEVAPGTGEPSLFPEPLNAAVGRLGGGT